MHHSPIDRDPRSRAKFAAWLLAQDHRDDAVGELARAARRDPAYPVDGDAIAVSRRLNVIGADGDVHAALEEAELDWAAW